MVWMDYMDLINLQPMGIKKLFPMSGYYTKCHSEHPLCIGVGISIRQIP